MPSIDVGDPLPNLAVEVENPPGTPVAVGAMTLTITLPDGTTATPAVTSPATGRYTTAAPYLATLYGNYLARWVATGANACVKERTYSVGDPVDLDDVKAAVRVAKTEADDLLFDLIAAATDRVESLSGRSLRRRTVVELRAGGKYAVALSQVPVIAVTGVTENGNALSSTPGVDWTLDPRTGLLYRGSVAGLGTWYPGPVAVGVTYTAGPTIIEPRFRQAIVEQVRHLLVQYRAASGTPSAGGDTAFDPRRASTARTVTDLVGARVPRF